MGPSHADRHVNYAHMRRCQETTLLAHLPSEVCRGEVTPHDFRYDSTRRENLIEPRIDLVSRGAFT